MISVITPVHNGEKVVSSCIDSVIKQNCPQVLEHIIINFSTDKTEEIVREHMKRYSHIKLLNQKETGISQALNAGIREAKGDVIAILNDDDCHEPNTLNRAAEIFTTLPEPSLLVGNCNVWDGKGNLLYVDKPYKLRIEDLLAGHLHPVNPSAYFYHKSLHDKAGFYNEGEDVAMDLEFLLKAVQKAHVKYVNEIWGNFLFCDGTLTYEDKKRDLDRARRKRILDKALALFPLKKRFSIMLRRPAVWVYDRIKIDWMK